MPLARLTLFRFCALGALANALAPAGVAQVFEVGPEGVMVSSISRSAPSPEDDPSVTGAGRVRPPASVRPLLETAGRETDLSARLIEAVSYVESRFDPDARSPKGAVGLMQLMPGTAEDLGVDPVVPAENASGGAQYLKAMLRLFNDNVELALAAYNAGPEAVMRYGGVPPFRETREYVSQVMNYLADISDPEPTP